jgi:hypothetical protein
VQEARAVLNFDGQAQITATVGKQFTTGAQTSIPVATEDQVVFIGAVPVLLTYDLSVEVGVSGSAEGSLTSSVTIGSHYTVGGHYVRGRGWNSVNDFSRTLDFQEPQFALDAEAKFYVKPVISVKVYGVVGPEFSVEGYVKGRAAPLENPWWTLSAGIGADAGFKAEAFGLTLVDYNVPLLEHEWLIAQASGGISTPTPTPTKTPTPTPTHSPTPSPTPSYALSLQDASLTIDIQRPPIVGESRFSCCTSLPKADMVAAFAVGGTIASSYPLDLAASVSLSSCMLFQAQQRTDLQTALGPQSVPSGAYWVGEGGVFQDTSPSELRGTLSPQAPFQFQIQNHFNAFVVNPQILMVGHCDVMVSISGASPTIVGSVSVSSICYLQEPPMPHPNDDLGDVISCQNVG